MDGDARLASLAYVAGLQLEIPEEELNEALRRALVVRAVGGNPQRELRLDEDAVTRFAEELDSASAAVRSGGARRPAPHVEDHPPPIRSNGSSRTAISPWRCFAAAKWPPRLG